MVSAMQSALAASLEVVLQGIGIHTLNDLASGIVDHGDDIAAYITSSGCRHAGLVAAQERERAEALQGHGKALQGHGEALQRHAQVPHLTPHSAPMAPHLR